MRVAVGVVAGGPVACRMRSEPSYPLRQGKPLEPPEAATRRDGMIAFDRPPADKPPERNVLGGPLASCSREPLTGFFRDGCCRTGPDDLGVHTVCAVMTEEFLEFTVKAGNDLVTPQPQWGFPGLLPGDRWCLCASRWLEAVKAGQAPPVVLEATHEKSLTIVSRELLERHAVKPA